MPKKEVVADYGPFTKFVVRDGIGMIVDTDYGPFTSWVREWIEPETFVVATLMG